MAGLPGQEKAELVFRKVNTYNVIVLPIFKFVGRATACIVEYSYISSVHFRKTPSGAFCDEEDVLEEIWNFPSSSDSDDNPDVDLYVMSKSEGKFC